MHALQVVQAEAAFVSCEHAGQHKEVRQRSFSIFNGYRYALRAHTIQTRNLIGIQILTIDRHFLTLLPIPLPDN
jgi:hypothetical protein